MAELNQTARDLLALEMGEAYANMQRLKDEKARNKLELQAAQERLGKLHDALSGGGVPEVSDHAVLRYAERVLGMNPEEIRGRILASIAPLAAKLGDGRYPVGHNCVAVVHNGVVVSVVPA